MRERETSVFFSYAHKDKALRDRLEEHLSNLKYRGLITTWHDREITAGDHWERESNMHLESASIVLLLVSASFMASHYCYSVEMRHALERHKRGEARVIPVLLRPVLFTDAPFAFLQLLPSNGKPIAIWQNRDKAFVNVVLGIERALRQHEMKQLSSDITSVQISPGQQLPPHEEMRFPIFFGRRAKRRKQEVQRHEREQAYYQQALIAYEQALKHNPSDTSALKGKGIALEALERYNEALEVFRQYVAINPESSIYIKMGDVFMKMNQTQEAIVVYEQAIKYDDQYALAFHAMGQALKRLEKISEAERAFEKAKQLGYKD